MILIELMIFWDRGKSFSKSHLTTLTKISYNFKNMNSLCANEISENESIKMLKSSKLLKKHISKHLFSSHLQNTEKYEMILKQWGYCIHTYMYIYVYISYLSVCMCVCVCIYIYIKHTLTYKSSKRYFNIT